MTSNIKLFATKEGKIFVKTLFDLANYIYIYIYIYNIMIYIYHYISDNLTLQIKTQEDIEDLAKTVTAQDFLSTGTCLPKLAVLG